MNAQRPIGILDCRGPGWLREALDIANEKLNFVVVLGHENDLGKVCQAFKCTGKQPDRLNRWSILGLSIVLQTSDRDWLLVACEENPTYLIEQLFLDRNDPPASGRYIVYCELRGIISEHRNKAEACAAFQAYQQEFILARSLPLAGVYRFKQRGWSPVK